MNKKKDNEKQEEARRWRVALRHWGARGLGNSVRKTKAEKRAGCGPACARHCVGVLCVPHSPLTFQAPISFPGAAGICLRDPLCLFRPGFWVSGS